MDSVSDLPEGYKAKSEIEKYFISRLLSIRPEAFNTALPGLGLKRGDQFHILNLVIPVMNFDPNGNAIPKGMMAYRTAGGVWTLASERNTVGDFNVNPIASAGNPGFSLGQSINTQLGFNLQKSDGTGALGSELTGANYMRHASLLVQAAVDGSLAAVQLIAAGAAGVKWVLYDLSIGAGPSSAVAFGGAGGCITLSDSCGYVGTGSARKGPTKQATAATAITVNAAAGQCAPSAWYTVNVSYRQGA